MPACRTWGKPAGLGYINPTTTASIPDRSSPSIRPQQEIYDLPLPLIVIGRPQRQTG